jgi:putative acyl-CoA dehydrogenase
MYSLANGESMATNQPKPLVDYNTYTSHRALLEAIEREAPDQDDQVLIDLGEKTGSSQVQQWVRQAHSNPPQLLQYDARGDRIDEVVFDQAWHNLMAMGLRSQAHSLGWIDDSPGASVTRAGLFYLLNEVDQSMLCPIGMTHDSFPALLVDEEIRRQWAPLVTSSHYDPRSVPVTEKNCATIAMGLTEQSAGTDLRNIESIATSTGDADVFMLNGLKWFYSAPQADAALVLAKTKQGLTCFLMPRFRPDGSRNSIFIRRLKSKVGDLANASSEVELVDAWAQLLGQEGKGLDVMFRMIKHSRSDAGISSAAMMHHATSQALHYASQRQVFGSSLSSMPLMENVLADLAIETEAATVLSFRLARDMDEEKRGVGNGDLTRIGVALNKYWNSKRSPHLIAEAMEVLGGNGYIEDHPMARLYRQAPLNSIWEGSGNVICLDVLRAMEKDPDSYEALLQEIALARGQNNDLDKLLTELQSFQGRRPEPVYARVFAEQLAVAIQASLLIRCAPEFVSDAFCSSRLSSRFTGAFGSLPRTARVSEIIDRAMPQ